MAQVFEKTGKGRFESEAEGLRLLRLASGGALHVPEVLFSKDDVGIRMERLQGLRRGSAEDARRLARGLRVVHDWTPPSDGSIWPLDCFGFPFDGQCGDLCHENNTQREPMDWVEFFARFRLALQLRQLEANQPQYRRVLELGKRLAANLDCLFSGQGVRRDTIRPCLLHGDLWSGNWGVITDTGEVAIYDPAPFFGHYEFDFGIGQMFDGFVNDDFIKSYFGSDQPAPPGFHERLRLYRLYHELNHLNMFGGSYAHGAERLLEYLCDKRLMGT